MRRDVLKFRDEYTRGPPFSWGGQARYIQTVKQLLPSYAISQLFNRYYAALERVSVLSNLGNLKNSIQSKFAWLFHVARLCGGILSCCDVQIVFSILKPWIYQNPMVSYPVNAHIRSVSFLCRFCCFILSSVITYWENSIFSTLSTVRPVQWLSETICRHVRAEKRANHLIWFVLFALGLVFCFCF